MDRPEERLALIELYERDGRVGRVIDVPHWPVSIGRALDNHVVLDDPHVAPHHALLGPDADGRVVVTPLPSRNGVVVGRKRLSGPAPLPPGGTTLTVGATRLRLRLGSETLAPERPLPGLGRMDRALPLVAGAVLLLLLLANHWVGLDPGADLSSWLPVAVGTPLMLAGWCGAWALMSKLFQHRFDFAGHLRIALPWLLGMALAEALWPQVTAALGLPTLWALGSAMQMLLLALLVRAHLTHVLPLHQRAVTAAVASVAVAGSAISLAMTWRGSDRWTSQPYMSTLPLPALRVAGTVPSQTLVQEMGPMAQKLAQRVKKARADDEDEGDAGE